MDILTSTLFSSQFLAAASFTIFSILIALLTVRSTKSLKKSDCSAAAAAGNNYCYCTCSCNGTAESSSFAEREMLELGRHATTGLVAERGSGASMMEQMVPEITTHALSYLDYPSLCRLSMTNSLMRKAANDDNAWKVLYHKVQDVRARVLTDMAWVTMKTYIDIDTGPFNMSNVFEFHNGQWYLVHHHSSVMLVDGEVEQQVLHG